MHVLFCDGPLRWIVPKITDDPAPTPNGMLGPYIYTYMCTEHHPRARRLATLRLAEGLIDFTFQFGGKGDVEVVSLQVCGMGALCSR